MEGRLGTEDREGSNGGVSQSERVGGALPAILPALPVLGALLFLACATTTASTPVTGEDMRMLDPERECERTAGPELLNRRIVDQAIRREYSQLLDPGAFDEGRRTYKTTLYLFIDQQGIVAESLVQASSGSASLDQSAIRVSREARFRPAMCDEEPVAVRITLPFTFTPG